ncbi:protein kinase [Streptomyces niveus]|uniref:serine/threonine-protein kinase n=1 Tax=Streptomyces niveus TaxID=193462 RepID=UPI0034133E3E
MLRALSDVSPRQIGPFTVLARIGAGGMGDVYLATPSPGAPVDRLVAVKTVRRDLADDPSFRRRFRRETALAGTVDSPYTVTPVDVDADADVPWMAVEYVAGPTLAEAVRRGGPLPPDAVRRLGADLAGALSGLHAAGIVHRDIKPGNVLLDLDRACLIDFGLARARGSGTDTEGDLVVGTPDFMSPEHLRGSRAVTAASDVFSLAAVLCYAASGRKPFGEGPVQVVQHRISTADASLDSVPDGLREILEECLSPDRARRPLPDLLRERLSSRTIPLWPAGLRTFIEECRLDAMALSATGRPLLAPPPTTDATSDPASTDPAAGEPKRRRGESQGKRRRIALTLALAAVLGAGVGLGTYLSRTVGRAATTAPTTTQPATGAPVMGIDDRGGADSSGAVPQMADGRPDNWRPWQGKLSGPAMGCAAGTAVLVCRLTDGTYETLDSGTGRKLWNIGRYDASSQTDTSPTGYVTFAARGTQPTVHGEDVVLSRDGWLQVRDARTGEIRWERESAGALGFSSRPLAGDGLVFAATVLGGNLGLTAFALADGRKVWSKVLNNQDYARAHMRDFEPVAYSEGRVYALSDGGIVSYDARTGEQRGQVQGGAKGCDSLRIAGPTAFCSYWETSGADPASLTSTLQLLRLDAVTLAPAGRLPNPRGIDKGGLAGLTAVDHRVALVYDPESLSPLDDDDTPSAGLIVLDQRTGKERGRFPVVPSGRENARTEAFSDALIAGDSLVYADYSEVHVVPLGKDGRPGKEHVLPVPGAPGPRPEEEQEPDSNSVPSMEIRPPVLLPLGGVAFVVYDKGTVASVALPG